MTRLKKIFVCVLSFCFFSHCGSSSSLSYETIPVTIQSSLGALIIFAEVADTEPKREEGLSNRLQLSDDAGMLFVFDTEEQQSFTVANTYLSLDIIFISAEKRIVAITSDTTPLSPIIISPSVQSLYVLEVNGSFSANNGIVVGDTLSF